MFNFRQLLELGRAAGQWRWSVSLRPLEPFVCFRPAEGGCTAASVVSRLDQPQSPLRCKQVLQKPSQGSLQGSSSTEGQKQEGNGSGSSGEAFSNSREVRQLNGATWQITEEAARRAAYDKRCLAAGGNSLRHFCAR